MKEFMTVQEAASLMGKSPEFIRIGLQRSILPFGYAVKTGKERYSYFITLIPYCKYIFSVLGQKYKK